MSLTSVSQASLSGLITADSTVVQAKMLFLILDYNYFGVTFHPFEYVYSEGS